MKARLRGVIHGKLIELEQDAGLPGGQLVAVTLETLPATTTIPNADARESLRRAAGTGPMIQKDWTVFSNGIGSSAESAGQRSRLRTGRLSNSVGAGDGMSLAFVQPPGSSRSASWAWCVSAASQTERNVIAESRMRYSATPQVLPSAHLRSQTQISGASPPASGEASW